MTATPAEKQDWSADRYARNARFVAELGAPVLALLSPQPGERVLDLGCGDGALTLKIAEAGADVLGLDAGPDMVQAARALGLKAQVADGQAFDVGAGFDAVFSNAALHWMPDQRAVFDCVFRALRPGGRFVAEMGGFGNVAAIRTALRGAYEIVTGLPAPDDQKVFPSPAGHRALLEAAGFEVTDIDLIPRPTPLPTGMAGWLATFSGRYTAGLPDDQAKALRAKAEELVQPCLRDEQSGWYADYMRLRFRAVRP